MCRLIGLLKIGLPQASKQTCIISKDDIDLGRNFKSYAIAQGKSFPELLKYKLEMDKKYLNVLTHSGCKCIVQ